MCTTFVVTNVSTFTIATTAITVSTDYDDFTSLCLYIWMSCLVMTPEGIDGHHNQSVIQELYNQYVLQTKGNKILLYAGTARELKVPLL